MPTNPNDPAAEPEIKRRSVLNDDIFAVLTGQHEEAKGMLEHLSRSSGESPADAEERRETARRLSVALISHNEAESQTLYKRLLAFEDMRAKVEAHRREHEEANTELQALLNIAAGDHAWLEKLLAIKKAVEAHIEDEEGGLFPQAKKRLDGSEAQALVKEFTYLQDLRKNLMQPA